MSIIPPSPNEPVAAALTPSPTRVPGGIVAPPGLPHPGCNGGDMVLALMRAGIVHGLGGRGPLTFDCWSMMQLVQWHIFDRIVETIDFEVSAQGRPILDRLSRARARRQWRLNRGAPRHGDVVTMAHAHEPYHVGVWLDCDRGVCLHCATYSGVTVDDRGSLVASGWFNLHFYSFREAA